MPVGGDFYWWYYVVPQAWRAGETRLYDASSRGFFLPPWGIWPYLPLTFLEAPLAAAVAIVLSACIIGGVAYQHALEAALPQVLKDRRADPAAVLFGVSGHLRLHAVLIAVLAAACPYSLVLYFTGTPDAWSLLGVWVAWLSVKAGSGWGLGAGAALALVRPQNCLLTLPALMVWARRGPAAPAPLPGRPGESTTRPLLQAAAVLALVLAASVLVSGPDWPFRWWENYAIRPPSPEGATTTYSALQVAGVPFWLSGLAGFAIALYALRRWALEPSPLEAGPLGAQASRLDLERLITLNAILTPFIRSPGYVLLLAIPWAGLAARRPLLAVLPYAVSLPTLVVPLGWGWMASLWPQVPYVDLVFPMALLATLLFERRRTAGKS